MILIISQSKLEASTNNIIEWLEYYNAPYYRLNGEDVNTTDYYLEVQNGTILNLDFKAEDVNVVWYRRWGNYSNFQRIKIDNDFLFEYSINTYLESEYKSLSYALFNMFEHAHWLSNPFNRLTEDKILYLVRAKKQGLKIPNTYIISQKDKLIPILKENNNALITKSIFNVKKIILNNEKYIQYTQEITPENSDSIPDSFFPSLFQEKIEKEYEIRTFYLDGELFSMAIFSQADEMTQADFRKYNFDRPNRTVPYKLPESIEKKLILFMQSIQLNTGSIDLIRSEKGEYVFLEVNPIGQFGMTSLPCNYSLEKKIAEYLIAKNNGKKFN